ncbi:ethanolamine ammonia-lyase subunit EutC [Massilia sp. CF038]|uniref:ethanolamine ammonia-lyase subunit EutC n=1 Tax=Massilia sp. CF038 TaxID=1881045 RepID=UPI000922F871|nr:ethanolamine ammonia-lyase subunit EutC [Massilia sp. CF038]SHG66398.1 Ethanolamine ammonia-lyase light chain [Massilia sp. CF038]
MSAPRHVIPNAWHALRALTDARIALGRAGVSVPSARQLEFQLAHARARDAVHQALDAPALAASLAQVGMPVVCVRSACPDRATYLQRPDLGRQLAEQDRASLQSSPWDLALVVADGLSALAIEQNALPFLRRLYDDLAVDGWTCAPLVVATQARVAIGDDIGAALGVKAVVVMIGERPGLSSPDSMGLYLTWAPQRGCSDAQRNCISNVRPAGLSYDSAAHKLRWLLSQARERQLSGVALKDETPAEASTLANPGRNFLLR